MHFSVNSKLWLHFSRIHKNGYIAFWNRTLQITSTLALKQLFLDLNIVSGNYSTDNTATDCSEKNEFDTRQIPYFREIYDAFINSKEEYNQEW
jgi:hypothetical protein